MQGGPLNEIQRREYLHSWQCNLILSSLCCQHILLSPENVIMGYGNPYGVLTPS
jgi:hypothetical protein